MDWFSEIAKPLHEATQNEEVEPITWSTEREKAFCTLKAALLSAPALGLPDYSKPFKLYCDENKGAAKGVLVQTLGLHERSVAYFSSTLDPVTKGTPFCIRAIAAAAEMPPFLFKNSKLIMLKCQKQWGTLTC
uniref:Reverse transcriptase/retrotransposon-derived protein RNase H-like domain-containing protein n=1 Tax=Strix occidentalis caurina TaxID=311401 RepID=A0A8D0FV41_STROC